MKFYEIIISLNMNAINLRICWKIQILYAKLKAALRTEVCEQLHHFLLHEAESFTRSRKFSNFYETRMLITKVTRGLYPELDKSCQTPNIIFLYHDFKVILTAALQMFAVESLQFFLRIRNYNNCSQHGGQTKGYFLKSTSYNTEMVVMSYHNILRNSPKSTV
jgi:hypothetical protein